MAADRRPSTEHGVPGRLAVRRPRRVRGGGGPPRHGDRGQDRPGQPARRSRCPATRPADRRGEGGRGSRRRAARRTVCPPQPGRPRPVNRGIRLPMRSVGAAATAQPLLSTGFRVSAGQAYTVAGMGPAAGLRLQVLNDTLAVPAGHVLIRVIQASLREHVVSVRITGQMLARKLDFASATPYQAVAAGSTVAHVAGDTEDASLGMSLRADTIHTLVVLDGAGHLRLTDLEDAAGSTTRPEGGAATGLGGMAPRPASSPLPWLAVIGTG